MTRFTSGMLPVAALLVANSPAVGADVLYESGFESPAFVAGQTIAGQDGWTAYRDENINAATVTAEAARSGTQSLKLDGAAMGRYHGEDFYAGFYYRGVSFDPIASERPILEFSVDALYVPNQGGEWARAQVELYDSGGSFIGAFSVDPAGKVLGWTEQAPAFESTCNLDGWNNFSASVNYIDHTVQFRVNGQSFGTAAMDPAVVDFYEADLSLIHNLRPSDQVVYYDNYRVVTHPIPEPASWALGVLGLALLGWSRAGVIRKP